LVFGDESEFVLRDIFGWWCSTNSTWIFVLAIGSGSGCVMEWNGFIGIYASVCALFTYNSFPMVFVYFYYDNTYLIFYFSFLFFSFSRCNKVAGIFCFAMQVKPPKTPQFWFYVWIVNCQACYCY